MRLLPKEHHIYCDESQTGARFLVYGGIVLPARDVDWFNALVDRWRIERNMRSELKWEKVTNKKYAEYRSLVDLFFDNSNRDRLHFKCLVLDVREVNYTKFHEGSEELGFYKFYYHFLLHKFGNYAKDETHTLRVFLDERSTRYKLTDLRKVLNRGIRKKNGLKLDVVRSVEPRISHRSNLLQVADVLMGAVGSAVNDMGEKPGARQAKKDLPLYIAHKIRMKSLKDRPAFGNLRFDIWRFRPRQERPDA